MFGQECRERIGRNRGQREILDRDRQVAIFLELDEHPAEARHVGLVDQALLHLRRLHRRRGGQRRFEIAIVLDQLSRGLGPDPADARHVVHRIAHQREHIADLFGRHAEFLDHFGDVDPLVLHRIEHIDAAATHTAFADELHQILVRTDDGHVPALERGSAGIAGDQVVGFEVVFLDAGQAERAGCVADQRELGDQVFGRGRAVGLVLIVQGVAKGDRALVEDHRQMRRAIGLVEVFGQPPQHRRIAIDRAHRHAVRVGERGQAMIGAEDVGGAIDEVEMLAFRHRNRLAAQRAGVTPCGRIALYEMGRPPTRPIPRRRHINDTIGA